MAKIKYNGKTLAEVLQGQKITLHTTDKGLNGELVFDGSGRVSNDICNTWVLNDTPSAEWVDPVLYPVTFKCDGQTYCRIYFGISSSGDFNIQYAYYDTSSGGRLRYTKVCDIKPKTGGGWSHSWASDAYKTIEILLPPPAEIDAWVRANGTAQSSDVNPLTNFAKVRNGSGMFKQCSQLSCLPDMDTSVITDMSYMFDSCYSLMHLPSINTSNVTNMRNMFNACKTLVDVPLLDTSKVRDMYCMFSYCSNLTTVPLLDTSNVTNMQQMFGNCSDLASVPLFDTSKVTTMYYMFSGCTALTSIPLFDTSKVTTMGYMFSGCKSLTEVPAFDTSEVTEMTYMFHNCSTLTEIPALDMRNVTSMSSIVNNCSALTDIRIRNIKSNIQISSGTSYGHLLTVDSLVHLIYELRNTGSSQTLTIGSTNLSKLADVYVKLIDITDEMRAEDDLVDEKLPFVRCESTDEGAQLITSYVSAKNWALK